MSTIIRCDVCGKAMEKAAGKIYVAPIVPGHALTSIMSSYTHQGDACEKCITNLKSSLKPRKPNGRKKKAA